MEKKSIGKFISALRRANGMTQKDLGERLFVSDKTVSRWECDECTPDLSLIPLIAETFGITTDELLRGEKNNAEKVYADPDAAATRQKEKSDRQLKLMLDSKLKSFRNLKLIAMGIAILGLIVCILCTFAFDKITLGFSLAVVLIVASQICLLCFASNSKILVCEDDDEEYNKKITEINSSITKSLINGTLINTILIALCVNFLTINKMNVYIFEFILSAFAFASIAYTLFHTVYFAFVNDKLISKGLLLERDVIKTHTEKPYKILILGAGYAIMVSLLLVFLNVIVPHRLVGNEENEIPIGDIFTGCIYAVLTVLVVLTVTYFIICIIGNIKQDRLDLKAHQGNYFTKSFRIISYAIFSLTAIVILVGFLYISHQTAQNEHLTKIIAIASIILMSIIILTTIVLCILTSVNEKKKQNQVAADIQSIT